MQGKKVYKLIHRNGNCRNASLTVEAALVLPVFLYFMLTFLYFIQVFTVQERIQSAITRMGLNLAKAGYVFKDFPDLKEASSLDLTVFDNEYNVGLGELADSLVSEELLKLYSRKYLDTEQINRSSILYGFDCISFIGSSILCGDDYIDIVVGYEISIPIPVFIIGDMQFVQRVRLRNWTGYEVAAAYRTEGTENEDETYVYISDTGSVYHREENCSHIKLSVSAVQGIPTGLRNEYGGKYTPCEACCIGEEDPFATYYITSDGTKYHSRRDCSKIKRSITKIKLSEAGSRRPCKRCHGGS